MTQRILEVALHHSWKHANISVLAIQCLI